MDTVGYANIASLRHALSGQQQLLRQHMLQTHAHEDYAGEQEEELRESVDFGASLLISKKSSENKLSAAVFVLKVARIAAVQGSWVG